MIIGGGTVGTNACKIAAGMGADVTILDVDIRRLEYLDDIFGARIQTLVSTDANIEKSVKEADMVVGSVLIPDKAAPKLIKRKYLMEMKRGAVTVDGVVHYCVGNMPGAVPRTSTIALTNATFWYGMLIAGKGLEEACRVNEAVYSAVNTYDGKLTCRNVAESLGMESTDVRKAMGE